MMKKMSSLLLALLMILSLAACGKQKPTTSAETNDPVDSRDSWTIRNDDYNYADRYFPFNDYDPNPDYWAKDIVQADRELEPGLLYVKDKEAGAIKQISADPVVSYAWNFGNTLLYATEKGELWRSGINGEQQAKLYTSNQTLDKLYFAYKGHTSQVNELTYVWPKDELFFLDGNMIVDLDLGTGVAENVAEIDVELFYSFYPWIDGRMAWNNLDGQFRTFDPGTKSVVVISQD